jgi:hypothetical protein
VQIQYDNYSPYDSHVVNTNGLTYHRLKTSLYVLVCLGSTYFRHTLRFAAHWIVVAFTLERLIVVYFPLQTSVIYLFSRFSCHSIRLLCPT